MMVAIQVFNSPEVPPIEKWRAPATTLYIRSFPYLCNEFSFVNVQIGSADTARLHLDQDIVVTELGKWDLDDSVLFWLRVAANEQLLAEDSN